MSIIHDLPNSDQMAKTLATLKAFGAPYGMILTELDAREMIDTVVEDMERSLSQPSLAAAQHLVLRPLKLPNAAS